MSHFDLVIIGTGSGNSILGPEHEGKKVAIVERDVFGGTCLNKGCIPTKMLVHAAEIARSAKHGSELGVDLTLDAVRWNDLTTRIFTDRIDPIAEGGGAWRRGDENPHVTVFDADARFVGPKELDVGGDTTITGDQFVLAAGARPFVPPIEGLDGVDFHTSDTVMRLVELPESMVVLGGGFIAMELAHVFEAFGVRVSVVNRSPALLREQDREVSERFTEIAQERFDCHLGVTINSVRQTPDGVAVAVTEDGIDIDVVGEVLLVATGRIPNADQLNVIACGVEVDNSGRVVTNDTLETNVEGVWALGDITNRFQLKHLANLEARVVRHNLGAPANLRTVDRFATPHAVFTEPQIGSVGATQQQLEADGIDHLVGRQDYGNTAYGWALNDSTGFCKVLVDPSTRLLLGAHVIGPMSGSLVQLVVQGMVAGQTVDDLARSQQYIHPAPTELIEQALLDVDGVDASL